MDWLDYTEGEKANKRRRRSEKGKKCGLFIMFVTD